MAPGPEVAHLVLDNPWSRASTQNPLVLQPGETYELPALTLDPDGRSVRGVLVDSDGQPHPGAKVSCHLPQSPVNSAVADEEGRFALSRLPVQGWDVWLFAADAARRLYVASPVDPDGGVEVRLVLRPLTSAGGILVREDGQPLGDAQLMVWPFLRCRMGNDGIAYIGWDLDGV